MYEGDKFSERCNQRIQRHKGFKQRQQNKLMKWFADLKTVAFSGSYNDLTDKPFTFNNLYAYNVVLTTDEQGLIIYKPASGAHPYLVQTLSSLENIVILLEPDESGTLKIRIRSATGDNAILSKRTVRLYIMGWR